MLNDLDKSGLDWTGRGYINKLLLLLEMGKVRGGVEENLDFLLFYFTFRGSLLCKTFNDLTTAASYGEVWPARSGRSGILRKIEREGRS